MRTLVLLLVLCGNAWADWDPIAIVSDKKSSPPPSVAPQAPKYRPQFEFGEILGGPNPNGFADYWLVQFDPSTNVHVFLRRVPHVKGASWGYFSDIVEAKPNTPQWPNARRTFQYRKFCPDCLGQGRIRTKAPPVKWGFTQINSSSSLQSGMYGWRSGGGGIEEVVCASCKGKGLEKQW